MNCYLFSAHLGVDHQDLIFLFDFWITLTLHSNAEVAARLVSPAPTSSLSASLASSSRSSTSIGEVHRQTVPRHQSGCVSTMMGGTFLIGKGLLQRS